MGDSKTTRFDDCLPPGCFLSVTPNAVRVDDATFEAAWDSMPPPHRFMGVEVRRRQCTWTDGAPYGFTGDGGNRQMVPTREAPTIVHECIRASLEAAHRLGYGTWEPTIAVANWYDGGTAALARHQDNERGLADGMPIFSFTFLGRDSTPRKFEVAPAKTGKATVVLEPKHGDMIVMFGENFQKTLWHGVPRTTAKAAARSRRINVTIRMHSE